MLSGGTQRHALPLHQREKMTTLSILFRRFYDRTLVPRDGLKNKAKLKKYIYKYTLPVVLQALFSINES